MIFSHSGYAPPFRQALRRTFRPGTEKHVFLLGHVPPSTARGLTGGSVYSIDTSLQRITNQREICYKTDRPEARMAWPDETCIKCNMGRIK